MRLHEGRGGQRRVAVERGQGGDARAQLGQRPLDMEPGAGGGGVDPRVRVEDAPPQRGQGIPPLDSAAGARGGRREAPGRRWRGRSRRPSRAPPACRGRSRGARAPSPARGAQAHRPAPAWRPRTRPRRASGRSRGGSAPARGRRRGARWCSPRGSGTGGSVRRRAGPRRQPCGARGIEQRPLPGVAAAPGSAVQEQDGRAGGIAPGLDPDPVSLARVEVEAVGLHQEGSASSVPPEKFR